MKTILVCTIPMYGKGKMIYSNCNKFYRRNVIERIHLRFDENTDFGEVRVFNYHYLAGCSYPHGIALSPAS